MHTYKHPHLYHRRILLVVIGMTPQIVTETLYKLAIENDAPFIPTDIHLITTKEGANSATLALLGVENDKGKYHQFCDDYGLADINFDENNIHIITDTEGQFLDDSQSTKHNKIASDFITKKICELTSDEDSALHVSLAGGRKTMSFYAGYALSLYGRMQDKLSHVLVNINFQNHKDFFYPRPKPELFEVDNKYYSTDEANIILSDIPYVRMRYNLPEKLLLGTIGFQETVERLQRSMEPPRVLFKPAKKELFCNDIPVKLNDSEYAFYLWMCVRKRDDEPPLDLEGEVFMSDFLTTYSHFTNKHSGMYERLEKVEKKIKTIEDQKKYFGPKKSTLKKKLEDQLGKQMAKNFLIQTIETEKGVTYEVEISKEAIKIMSLLDNLIA